MKKYAASFYGREFVKQLRVVKAGLSRKRILTRSVLDCVQVTFKHNGARMVATDSHMLTSTFILGDVPAVLIDKYFLINKKTVNDITKKVSSLGKKEALFRVSVDETEKISSVKVYIVPEKGTLSAEWCGKYCLAYELKQPADSYPEMSRLFETDRPIISANLTKKDIKDALKEYSFKWKSATLVYFNEFGFSNKHYSTAKFETCFNSKMLLKLVNKFPDGTEFILNFWKTLRPFEITTETSHSIICPVRVF